MLVLPHIPSRNKKQWDSPPMFIPLFLQRKQYSYQRPTSPHVVCKVCITTSPTFSRKSCSILMSKRCLKFNSLFPSLSSLKSYFPPNLFQHFQWHPYLCNCSRWKSGSILDFPSLTTLIELYPFPLITYIQFSSKYCSFCLLKYPICICFFLISMKSTLYKPPSHLGSFSILAGLPTSAFPS